MVGRRFAVILLAVVATVGFARSARADEAGFDELKRRGNQAMLNLDFSTAIESYRAAIAIDPADAVIYYNLARALQAREDFVAASDALDEFATRANAEVRAKVKKLDDLRAEVRGRIGSIALTCSADAADATVKVGDVGSTAGCGLSAKGVRVSLPSGRATVGVRIESERLQSSVVTVDLVGGAAPVAVRLDIAPRATTGILAVTTTPPASLVLVDGTPRGNSPLDLPLLPGPHRVRIEARAHETYDGATVVDLGKRRELSITLEKTPPLTSRWWFWTGVVVVTAGVVTLTYILVAQPEKDSGSGGTLAPNKIRAPLITF